MAYRGLGRGCCGPRSSVFFIFAWENAAGLGTIISMKKILLLLVLVSPLSLRASDHIDGPITMKHSVSDLTDLYAFPSPGKPGFLTVILNAYPVVPGNGHFSEKVSYDLILRQASIKGTGDRPRFETGKEVRIACKFTTPHDDSKHTVNCETSNGLSAEEKFGVVSDSKEGDFRLFSGHRSDPFFFNANWATSASTKFVLLPAKDDNVMAQINVLSIIIEVEAAKLFGPGAPSMIAIAAESTTQDSPGSKVRRLDRLGRPEITNVSLVTNAGEELRDLYNQDKPFQVPAANAAKYSERLNRNIKSYDAIDKKQDWKDAEREALVALLVDDFLVVDLSKPCESDDFFEIEKSMMQHKAHATCGGRKLTDDIMDRLFSLYIGGLEGPRVKDGVDKPFKDPLAEFPYLDGPERTLWARTKAMIARRILGIGK